MNNLTETQDSSNPKYEPLYNKVALIDSDIIVHRSAAIAEPTRYLVITPNETVEFENAKDMALILKEDPCIVWTRKEDKGLDFALLIAKNSVESIIEKTKPSGMKLYLTGRDNFRYKVAKTVPYKGSREITGKPKYFRKVREFLINEYGAITTDGYEADDAIGIQSTELGRNGFVCTIDKDMDQLAGWHYDWVKDRVYRISRREADFNLGVQVLAGDSTDDVPGLAGIGPVKARKILEGATSSSDIFRRIWDQYRTGSDGQSENAAWEYFLEQLLLVRVLRCEDDLTGQVPGLEDIFGTTPESVGE